MVHWKVMVLLNVSFQGTSWTPCRNITLSFWLASYLLCVWESQAYPHALPFACMKIKAKHGIMTSMSGNKLTYAFIFLPKGISMTGSIEGDHSSMIGLKDLDRTSSSTASRFPIIISLRYYMMHGVRNSNLAGSYAFEM